MARWKVIEQKLKNYGRDITFADATTLLEHYGYSQNNMGRTSGSRVRFVMEGPYCINLILKRN